MKGIFDEALQYTIIFFRVEGGKEEGRGWRACDKEVEFFWQKHKARSLAVATIF